ncbi:hypothetical protein CEXT_211571 [Caerostris extrusa]|uniref:Uncharacterized protein n=1 Tax=Caerostris extrusa TaxID=172846 RepID=A0AAV4WXB3_CAEEX|nr:hypothetical protein CEXT_211571 [Caerostris extrusa]
MQAASARPFRNDQWGQWTIERGVLLPEGGGGQARAMTWLQQQGGAGFAYLSYPLPLARRCPNTSGGHLSFRMSGKTAVTQCGISRRDSKREGLKRHVTKQQPSFWSNGGLQTLISDRRGHSLSNVGKNRVIHSTCGRRRGEKKTERTVLPVTIPRK